VDGPIDEVTEQYERDMRTWTEPGIDGEFEVDALAGEGDDANL
jgi:hypothetical protein